MKWIFFLVICILQSPKCYSQRGMDEVHRALNEQNEYIYQLQDDVKSNVENLEQIQGYLNAIGLGRSSDPDDLCEGWTQLTSSSCIKILDRLETYEDALTACRNEFQLGKDISHPTLLKISSGKMNDGIIKLLENVTFVSAVWIDGETGNYTNFGGTTKTARMDCVELRNVGVRGKWFHVECERKNSIICEKKIVLGYSIITEKCIKLMQNPSNFANFSADIDKNIEHIRKLQEKQISENREQNKAMQQRWIDKVYILENKLHDLEQKYENSLPPVTVNTIKPRVKPSVVNRILHRHSELHAIIAATLPHSLSHTASVYDGDDSIYIFGRHDDNSGRNEIYRLSLSTNAIFNVGIFPTKLYTGSVVKSGDNIFYFGGYNGTHYTDKVLKFDISKNTVKEIAQLGTPFGDGEALVLENTEDILLIDGEFEEHKYIKSFNTRTLSTRNIAILKNKSGYSSAFVHGKSLIIFSKGEPSVEVVNLTLLTTTARVTALPRFECLRAAVVSDGTFGYIIGGYKNSTTSPSNALIRFDPNSFKHEFIPVNNFPSGENTNCFYETSAVYVEKLNRIYIIGGYTYTNKKQAINHNNIWYIELGLPSLESQIPTMQISTTEENTCDNKPNGFHPYPGNSTAESKFIGCLNGTAEIFKCPSPLSFDIATSACNYPPRKMNDLLTCENKVDGLHPHPQNCEMFLGCQDGFLDILKCPHPLRFDSVSLKCTYPEMATCATPT